MELAGEPVAWVVDGLNGLAQANGVVTDGVSAKRPFVRAVLRPGVVLVRAAQGWAAFFGTDPTATVMPILRAVADRAAIERDFPDVNEIHGVGHQQVRHIANLADFNLNLWLHTLIELGAWDQPANELRDRRASPWDQADRRPSHADRRNAVRRECRREILSLPRVRAA